MVIALKRLIEWIILFMFFFFIALILYRVVFLVNEWIHPIEKFKEPTGHSIKVVDMDDGGRSKLKTDFIKRLRLYYWLGE